MTDTCRAPWFCYPWTLDSGILSRNDGPPTLVYNDERRSMETIKTYGLDNDDNLSLPSSILDLFDEWATSCKGRFPRQYQSSRAKPILK